MTQASFDEALALLIFPSWRVELLASSKVNALTLIILRAQIVSVSFLLHLVDLELKPLLLQLEGLFGFSFFFDDIPFRFELLLETRR